MQSASQRDFVGRTLYYWAATYAGQLTKKGEYGALRPVVCINVLDLVLRTRMKCGLFSMVCKPTGQNNQVS